LNPSDALAYFNRGYAYGEIGDYEKAIVDYSKAIELNPSDALAYYNRGLDYHNKGEVPKAVSDLEKCIGLSTDRDLTKAAQQALHKIENSP
jgi:tetratricopeptide (TPR) repeat protein